MTCSSESTCIGGTPPQIRDMVMRLHPIPVTELTVATVFIIVMIIAYSAPPIIVVVAVSRR